MTVDRKLNLVPFVSVDQMIRLINGIGAETLLTEFAGHIENDFADLKTSMRGSEPNVLWVIGRGEQSPYSRL